MSQLKSLELRVNSVSDAQSVASQSLKITKEAKEKGLSIEILIEDTVKLQVQPYLAGLFGSVKVYHSFVGARQGNTLYQVPHLKVQPVAAPAKKNKGGRPRTPVLEKP